jgi:hypothetical protein
MEITQKQHDIISSSETLLAKLANISEGVNTMNTICKTKHKVTTFQLKLDLDSTQ